MQNENYVVVKTCMDSLHSHAVQRVLNIINLLMEMLEMVSIVLMAHALFFKNVI